MAAEEAGSHQPFVFNGPEVGTWLANIGASLSGRPGWDMLLKAGSSDTGGAYSLMESTMPVNVPGPRIHMHPEGEEAWYVIEGALTVEVDGKQVVAEPGSFVLVPRGVAHSFRTYGDRPCRYLLLFSPPRDVLWQTLHNMRAAAGDAPLRRVEVEALLHEHGEFSKEMMQTAGFDTDSPAGC